MSMLNPYSFSELSFCVNLFQDVTILPLRKKTALILMDYPSRTRLKIRAETEILDPDEHPELLEMLAIPDYKAKIERLVLFHIKAFDWNCPQHITPKFSIEEVKKLLKSDDEFRDYVLKN